MTRKTPWLPTSISNLTARQSQSHTALRFLLTTRDRFRTAVPPSIRINFEDNIDTKVSLSSGKHMEPGNQPNFDKVQPERAAHFKQNTSISYPPPKDVSF